tara:strand:- start:1599 stop:1775 length:177 start_codon:yes stop_codon:yes gene_type:complete
LFGAAFVDILNIVLQPFAGKKEKKIVLVCGMIGDYPHNGIVFTNQSTVTDLKGGFEGL